MHRQFTRRRHSHYDGRIHSWMLRRYLRRFHGDELRALEEYRRDIEEHLADVSDRIRELEQRAR